MPSHLALTSPCWSTSLPPSHCHPCLQVRQASREAAIREVKERAKKAKVEKAKAAGKSGPKGGAVPAPKTVGRGKR